MNKYSFYIVSRTDVVSNSFKHGITEKLIENDWIENEENPEIVIAVGGDGTMLHAFQQFKHCLETASFVGLHTGHLGFYADWVQEELEDLINHLLYKEIKTVKYPIIEMDTKDKTYYALNDITIKNISKTFVADIRINEEQFEQFRGDGLCISTPSGSTAYNKGLGGAIVHPSLECIQLSEMSSINNKIFRTIGSSIILPKHHNLGISCENPPKELKVICDHLELPDSDIDYLNISFKVSKKKISFVRFKRHPFWNRVRDAFI